MKETFRGRLGRLMGDADMGQSDLSRLSGIEGHVISLYLSGELQVTAGVIALFASALGIRAKALAKHTDAEETLAIASHDPPVAASIAVAALKELEIERNRADNAESRAESLAKEIELATKELDLVRGKLSFVMRMTAKS